VRKMLVFYLRPESQSREAERYSLYNPGAHQKPALWFTSF
jgi:hypothetical protein